MANTNFVLAEYIWIGGHGELRSKTKVIHGLTSVTLEDLPKWNYDGSSTDQAPGEDSEVIIVPRAVYRDPFRRKGNNVLVVADTYVPNNGGPLPTNSRNLANDIFESKPDEEPWFGIEQEYTLFKGGRPLGWPKSSARQSGGPLQLLGYPAPQGPYYCSAGAGTAFGGELVEMHLEYCLYAGLKISGINAEVMPGQWEFQVGPCEGIESGDMLTAARYILHRCSEKFNIVVSFEPKPIPGDWNGAGCHTNFSTKAMRENRNALEKVIIPAVVKLGKRHKQHIKAYGAGNDERLTGEHETAGIDKFSYDVADRGASVRIPNSTAKDKKGYFEDRRPASNMDPYIVTSMIFDSAVLDGANADRFAGVKTEGVDIAVDGGEPGAVKPFEDDENKPGKVTRAHEKVLQPATADVPAATIVVAPLEVKTLNKVEQQVEATTAKAPLNPTPPKSPRPAARRSPSKRGQGPNKRGSSRHVNSRARTGRGSLRKRGNGRRASARKTMRNRRSTSKGTMRNGRRSASSRNRGRGAKRTSSTRNTNSTATGNSRNSASRHGGRSPSRRPSSQSARQRTNSARQHRANSARQQRAGSAQKQPNGCTVQ